MEESTIQDVQTKQLMKGLLQENCMAISSEADHTKFEPLVCSSYQLSRDFKEGCMQMQAQYEDEVDKDIIQFLFDLVNE
eukprot:9694621-Ditylum_brightwellii.AAC.1